MKEGYVEGGVVIELMLSNIPKWGGYAEIWQPSCPLGRVINSREKIEDE
jgi:hypothetical protein